MNKLKCLLSALVICPAALSAGVNADPVPAGVGTDPVPAFPGAEGFGRYTTGGRGGAVYHVTTLEDNGLPGSFRYACNQPGRRTIVFDVSGTIYLKSQLRLEQPDVTIAGQTAPGDGVCIADFPFTIQADNVILRFMRFRLGDRQVAHHEGDGLGGSGHRNVIVDHCSVSWSIDECLSVYGMRDCTVQWCIASHSLHDSGHQKGPHGYGGNWGGSGASFHHNLIANHTSRTPRLGPSPHTQTDERMDLRNNVIYNYGSNGCYGGEGMTVNIVNNYFRPGVTTNMMPERIASPGIRTVRYCLNTRKLAEDYNALFGTSFTKDDVKGTRSGQPADGKNQVEIGGRVFDIDMTDNMVDIDGKKINVKWNVWTPMLHKWGRFYVRGNVNHEIAAVGDDNWKLGVIDQIQPKDFDNYWDSALEREICLDSPMEYAPTTTHTAEKAYELVLDYAGASLRRDAYDEIVIADTRSGKASFGKGGIINSQDEVVYADGSRGWPELKCEKAPRDTDGDGMPDAWEKANGLDPKNASDGSELAESGYTNLEVYMNSLVAPIMEAGLADGKLMGGKKHFSSAFFDKNFQDRTLRLDYLFSATPEGERAVHLSGQSSMKGWAGRRFHLSELPLQGNGTVTVCSEATGDTLYRTSFSSLYHEWLTTDEAAQTPKSFEHCVLVPYPKEAATIYIDLLDNRHERIAGMKHRFDPKDILIAKKGQGKLPDHRYIHRGGDPAEAIDVVILAEGYKKDEMDSFYRHAEVAVESILAYDPFKERASKFNFVAVATPSEDSGVSVPRLDDWKSTAFSSNFSTFYSDRYLTTLHVKDIHDAIAGIPYEHIIILANTEEYGGGGIYNSYTLTTSRHKDLRPVVVHEFGHSFGGLADEYFYEGDVMDNSYPLDVEPWEPNLTTLVDFDSKWKSQLAEGTPVPTPVADAEKYPLGVYEGGGYTFHGVYRPADRCRMRDNAWPVFCPACREALAKLIDFYVSE
nr:M64 family metallopeptidase [uncultured Duncaniella sp.]